MRVYLIAWILIGLISIDAYAIMSKENIFGVIDKLISEPDLKIADVDVILKVKLQDTHYVNPITGARVNFSIYEWENSGDDSALLKVKVKKFSELNSEWGIITIELCPESYISWDDALAFGRGEKQGLQSDAGGRLTTIKFKVGKNFVFFSKKYDTANVHKIVIAL